MGDVVFGGYERKVLFSMVERNFYLLVSPAGRDLNMVALIALYERLTPGLMVT